MSPGDVCFGYFLQEEGEFFDKRPFLVLIAEPERVFAAKITTSPIRAYWGVRLNAGKQDLSDGALQKESFINLSRVQWVRRSDIISKIGTLKEDIYQSVLEKYKGL